jgi:tRNA threonylcarbamoyladenosine biosynthesis protein TsaE
MNYQFYRRGVFVEQENVLGHWVLDREDDLVDLVKNLRPLLQQPALIILTGPVGVGKTTFTKYFVEQERSEDVLSPTYSIVNEVGRNIHADLYRIEDPEELVHLEFELYLEGKDFFLVEWGKPFLKEIKRNVPVHFHFYEVVFKFIEGERSQRSISLYGL